MPDKNEVIETIEICYGAGHNCTECRRFSEDGCNDKLMQDVLLREQDTVDHALDVLKAHGWKNEQAPVAPEWRQGKPHCGGCGLQIASRQRFCPWCGKAVKWHG